MHKTQIGYRFIQSYGIICAHQQGFNDERAWATHRVDDTVKLGGVKIHAIEQGSRQIFFEWRFGHCSTITTAVQTGPLINQYNSACLSPTVATMPKSGFIDIGATTELLVKLVGNRIFDAAWWIAGWLVRAYLGSNESQRFVPNQITGSIWQFWQRYRAARQYRTRDWCSFAQW